MEEGRRKNPKKRNEFLLVNQTAKRIIELSTDGWSRHDPIGRHIARLISHKIVWIVGIMRGDAGPWGLSPLGLFVISGPGSGTDQVIE